MVHFDDTNRDEEIERLKARIAMLSNTIYRMEKVLKKAYNVSLSETPLEMTARLKQLADAFEEYKK
jgi:hypothetical protein